MAAMQLEKQLELHADYEIHVVGRFEPWGGCSAMMQIEGMVILGSTSRCRTSTC